MPTIAVTIGVIPDPVNFHGKEGLDPNFAVILSQVGRIIVWAEENLFPCRRTGNNQKKAWLKSCLWDYRDYSVGRLSRDTEV